MLSILENRKVDEPRQRRRDVPIVASILIALCLSSCAGSAPRDLIIGKWKAGQGGLKVSAEFATDNTAKLTMFGQTVHGVYKIDGDDLTWTLNGITTKMKIKVTATELDVTGSDGQTIVYSRE